ncbi:MAG: 30S ribosomal protein S20 [Planctomycetota bacterium]|nr:30S ribosomal protein S20 [Planctomycetota bacterium]
MAHSLSAKKRIRQNLKNRARNRARKDMIKDQSKVYQTALASGDHAKAETELRVLVSKMDKVASKNTIHKNNAARKRSRLTRHLNAAKIAGKVAKPAKGAKAKA